MTIRIFLAAACLFSLVPLSRAQEFAHEDTRQLVNLVDAAAERVREKGEAAFPEIREMQVKWHGSDAYVFAGDLDGVVHVQPARPEDEGKNLLDLTDVDGRPFVRWAIEAARSERGSSWIHYKWTRPGGSEPTWKTSYVVRATAPSGKDYFVGSGLHEAPMERAYLVETVDAAARLLESEGAEAFDDLDEPAGPFRYRDVYVFVIDEHGIERASGGFPELEGKNVMDLQDATGKFIVREAWELLAKDETAWLEYAWPHPGREEPVRKASYLRRVRMGEVQVMVGAGMYLDE